MRRATGTNSRRDEISDAVLRVVAGRGLEAVSLRNVAAEAGVSAGMVQHHFPTRDAMLTYALDRSRGVIADRIAHQAATASSPRDLARIVLSPMIPLDDAGADELRIILATLAYTSVRPAVVAEMQAQAVVFRGALAESIRTAPGAPGAAHAEVAAIGLVALAHGLAMQVLYDACPPGVAMALLDAHLDRVFGPE